MKRVDITLLFAASVCIFAWIDMAICGLFLVALFCHEMGHLLTMKCSGASICRFRLSVAGAVIQGEFMGYRQEAFCAAGGPVFGLILSICSLRWCPKLAAISFVLTVVNLLPVYPLDGGRILRCALLLYLDPDNAIRILRKVTAVVCCILMIVACWVTSELQSGIWPVFAVLVLLWRVGQAQRLE